jgi:hypothetical protein
VIAVTSGRAAAVGASRHQTAGAEQEHADRGGPVLRDVAAPALVLAALAGERAIPRDGLLNPAVPLLGLGPRFIFLLRARRACHQHQRNHHRYPHPASLHRSAALRWYSGSHAPGGGGIMTAMVGRRRNRQHWAKQGWGRGADPGSKARPRTISWDLCPTCLLAEQTALGVRARERAAARAELKAQRLAKANQLAAEREARRTQRQAARTEREAQRAAERTVKAAAREARRAARQRPVASAGGAV